MKQLHMMGKGLAPMHRHFGNELGVLGIVYQGNKANGKWKVDNAASEK